MLFLMLLPFICNNILKQLNKERKERSKGEHTCIHKLLILQCMVNLGSELAGTTKALHGALSDHSPDSLDLTLN